MYYENHKKDKNYLKEQFKQNENNLKKIKNICFRQQNEHLKMNCNKLFNNIKPISSTDDIENIDFDFILDDKKDFFVSWVVSTLESDILKIRTFVMKKLNDNINESKYQIAIKFFCLLDSKLINSQNLNNFHFNFGIFQNKKLKEFYSNMYILAEDLNSVITNIKKEFISWGGEWSKRKKIFFIGVEGFLQIVYFFSIKTLKIFDDILNMKQNNNLKELTENLILMEAYFKYFLESEVITYIKIKNYFLKQEEFITNIHQQKSIIIDIENKILREIESYTSIKTTKEKFKKLKNECDCPSCQQIENLFKTKINIKRNIYAHNSYTNIIDEDFDILNNKSQNIETAFYKNPFNLILTLMEKSYWWLAFFIITLDHDKWLKTLNKTTQKLF